MSCFFLKSQLVLYSSLLEANTSSCAKAQDLKPCTLALDPAVEPQDDDLSSTSPFKAPFLYYLCTLIFLAFPLLANAERTPPFIQLYPQHQSITLARYSGKPLLVTFWRSDCAPCRLEQPILLEIAHTHPQLQIALISLMDETHTRSAFPALPASNIDVLLAKGEPGNILHALGDTRSILPFSAYYYSDGTVCDTHYGVLGTDIVNDWIKEC